MELGAHGLAVLEIAVALRPTHCRGIAGPSIFGDPFFVGKLRLPPRGKRLVFEKEWGTQPLAPFGTMEVGEMSTLMSTRESQAKFTPACADPAPHHPGTKTPSGACFSEEPSQGPQVPGSLGFVQVYKGPARSLAPLAELAHVTSTRSHIRFLGTERRFPLRPNQCQPPSPSPNGNVLRFPWVALSQRESSHRGASPERQAPVLAKFEARAEVGSGAFWLRQPQAFARSLPRGRQVGRLKPP